MKSTRKVHLLKLLFIDKSIFLTQNQCQVWLPFY